MALQSLSYRGFDGGVCYCDYRLIQSGVLPGGLPAIVFVQSADMTTSITNRIEAITSKALETFLCGTLPKKVRVFEFYPASLKPIVDWQEVTFSQVFGCSVERGFLSSWLYKLRGSQPDFWSVASPSWHSVGSEVKMRLAKLLTAA